MKIVINKCYGGFSLSDEAIEMYLTLKGRKFYKCSQKLEAEQRLMGSDFLFCPKEDYDRLEKEFVEKDRSWVNFNKLNLSFCSRDIPRDDPDLVKVVRKLKGKANGYFAKLKIVTIPDDVKWEIDEYNGMECVEEVHRSWS